MSTRDYIQYMLEKIGQKLHIDLPFYARSFAWTGTSHVSAVVRGVVTTFLMARLLPVTTFGEFRYLLAIFGIAGTFSLTGIHASIIRGIARGDTAVVRGAMKRILAMSLLGSLLLLATAAFKASHQEKEIALNLVFIALLFPLYCISGLYGPILTGKNEIRKVAKITTVTNIIFSFLFLPLICSTKSLTHITLGYFVVDIILRLSNTLIEVRHTPSRGDAREHLRLGTHLSAINMIQSAAFQLDQLLIQYFFGYASLANYNIALLIPDQIKDFASSMSTVVLKRYSEHIDARKVLRNTRRHFWIVLSGSALIVLAYALAAPPLFAWLFPQYSHQAWISVLYAGSLLSLSSMVGVNFFQAHNQTKTLWQLFGVNTAVQISANLVLIPVYGNLGAIYSRILSRLLTIPLTYPRIRPLPAKTSDTPL